jgi:ubiquinone/menaquinone biosynthesis C-methylase UbiE
MEKEEDYVKAVDEHYKKQAKQHGTSLTSTMPDQNIRKLEIENIKKYLKNGQKCLEVGCGNGATSIILSNMFELDLLSIDVTKEMIDIANSQEKHEIKGKLNFLHKNILELDSEELFDVVFTIRCIINLMDWKHQCIALDQMSDRVKSNGNLILLEAFSDGLEELNQARDELGFKPIPPAHHNLHLKKEMVIERLKKKGLKFVEENNFLSTYYFGTRVIYPALAKASNVDMKFNSKIDSFFSHFPPYGNFAHIKILVFKKI